MRKHTPESRAWLLVAEEFETGWITSDLICPTLQNNRGNDRINTIPLDLRLEMKWFVRKMLGDGALFAYHPSYEAHTQEQRDARVMALLLFSEMAKDGRAAINA